MDIGRHLEQENIQNEQQEQRLQNAEQGQQQGNLRQGALQQNVPSGADLIIDTFDVRDVHLYHRVMSGENKEKNIRLMEKVRETINDGEWKAPESRQLAQEPHRELPAAKDTYKGRKHEKAAIKKLQETYSKADRCTVREKAALEEHFAAWQTRPGTKLKLPPNIEGKDEQNNPELMAYVRSILDLDLTDAHFSDAYLSANIVSMYEFGRKLSMYENLKTSYPIFFQMLSEDDKARLEMKAGYAAEFNSLIEKHLNLHGLTVKNGNVTLVKDSGSKNEIRNSYEKRESAYEKDKLIFYKKNVLDASVKLAEAYTNGSYKSADMDGMIEQYRGHETAGKLFGKEMETACARMKRYLDLRDDLIRRQSELLGLLADAGKDAHKILRIKEKINKTNMEIARINKCQNHYKEFLDMVTGASATVSGEAADFLQGEEQDSIFRIVHFKMVGDCIEGGKNIKTIYIIKERIRTKENEIEKLKKKDKLEEADRRKLLTLQEEIDGLNEALGQVPPPELMSTQKFYEKWQQVPPERIARGKKYREFHLQEADRALDTIKKAKETAEKQGLHEVTDRITMNIIDKFDALHINRELLGYAFSYEPTDDTPFELRERVGKEVIRPIVDAMLALDDEKLEELAKKPQEEWDIDSPEFWKINTLMRISTDWNSFLSAMRNWDVGLQDEEMERLKTITNVTENIGAVMQKYFENLEYPAYVFTEDLTAGEIDLMRSAFQQFGSAYDKRIDEYANKYSESGPEVPLMNSHLQVKNQSVFDYADEMLFRRYFSLINSEHLESKESFADLIKEGKALADEALKKEKPLTPEEELRKEMEAMKIFYPDYGEEEAKIRLHYKHNAAYAKEALPPSIEKKWKEKFGSEVNGGDYRSFKPFLRKVERDMNGALRVESFDNRKKNVEEMNAMLSDDMKLKAPVLKRIGEEMLAINITEEMFSFDYIKKNYLQLIDMADKINGFQNIAKEYAGFFESDAFSEEQKDKLRNYFIEGKAIAYFANAVGVFKAYFGINDRGGEINLEAGKLPGDPVAKAKATCAVTEEQVKGICSMMSEAFRQDEERKALYTPQNTPGIRKASRINAAIREKLNQAEKDKSEADTKLNTASAKLRNARKRVQEAQDLRTKNEAQRECEAILNSLGSLKAGKRDADEVYHYYSIQKKASEDIREFLRGKLAKEALSEEAIVFAGENGFDGIFSEEEIETAELALEKKDAEKNWEKVDDETARLRLRYKKMARSMGRYNEATDDEVSQEFQDKFSDTTNYDHRSYRGFISTLYPVRRDMSGRVLPQYEDNLKKNNESLRDFTSGDMQRRQSRLAAWRKELLDAFSGFDEKTLTVADLKEHIVEWKRLGEMWHKFLNIYTGNLDFFESDYFTTEERDELRKIINNESFDRLPFCIDYYMNTIGMTGNGTDMGFNYDTEEEKAGLIARTKQKSAALLSSVLANYNETLKKGKENTDQAYEKKANAIRNLNKLHGLQKARYRDSRGKIRQLRFAILSKEKEQWKGMTEEQKTSWLNEQNAQIEAYEKERDEAIELDKFIFGLKELWNSADETNVIKDKDLETIYRNIISKANVEESGNTMDMLLQLVKEAKDDAARIIIAKKKMAEAEKEKKKILPH